MIKSYFRLKHPEIIPGKFVNQSWTLKFFGPNVNRTRSLRLGFSPVRRALNGKLRLERGSKLTKFYFRLKHPEIIPGKFFNQSWTLKYFGPNVNRTSSLGTGFSPVRRALNGKLQLSSKRATLSPQTFGYLRGLKKVGNTF